MKRAPLARRAAQAVLAAAGVTLLCPTAAAAHLVTTGLGPFYDGVSHLAITPEDLLPALALALLAGLRGPEASRRLLWLLPLAWLAGGIAGLRSPGLEAPLLTSATFLVLGILVAADAKLSLPLLSGIATGVGALHGFLDGAAVAPAGLGWLGIVGMVSGVAVVLAVASARVVSLRAAWTRIAVRVGGSWIAATGLLMLGWTLRLG